MNYVYYAIVVIAAYLIGGISIANALSKKLIGKKISEVGSGNTGASNMIRNCGWAAGIGTLAFDAAKAFFTLMIVNAVFKNSAPCAVYVAAVAVTVGHIWPIWVGFKGGKGVACTLGAMLYLMPWITLIVLAICGLITVLFKTMSITSFTGIGLMLVATLVYYYHEISFLKSSITIYQNTPFLITVLIIFAVTVFTHRGNIGRLIRGEEAKVKIGNEE